MPTCSVTGCQNRPEPGSNIIFYRLPVGSHPFQKRRRQLWLEAMRRPDASEDFIRIARICSAHFISGKASVDSNSPDFVPSVFAYTDETPKSQNRLGSLQKKRKGDENATPPEKRSNVTVSEEQPAAPQVPDTGTPSTPLVTKKRRRPISRTISPHKSPAAAPGTANGLDRPLKTLSKSEIQELIKQEILVTIKQSENRMNELIERAQKTDAQATVPKYDAIIARMQADIAKIKRREQAVLTFMRKQRHPALAPLAGHNQRPPSTPPHTRPILSREASLCISDPPSPSSPCPTTSSAAPDTPDAFSRTDAEGECGQSREPSNQGSPETSRTQTAPTDASVTIATGRDKEVVFCGVSLPRKRIVEGFWQRRLKGHRVVDLTEDRETDAEPGPDLASETPQNQSQDSVEAEEQRAESPPDTVPGSAPGTPCSQREEGAEELSAADEVVVSALSQTPCGSEPPADPDGQTTPEGRVALEAAPPPRPAPARLPDAAGTTNPPQQVALTLARIRNPKGIGALWTVERPDPRAADVRQYHLYALQEDRQGRLSDWRSVGVLRAMSLPMACKLSDHGPARRFCFAIVSEDVHGRYGPYSEIQSILTPGD
ncbi:hypothetical protein AAFF_G00160230 [Aldrovandia affinis]|uniref:THAP-type domain-containing protein n=1 Tax=Aldrovandia affinis TaxID=143900 RepID=A0AAD7RMK2_9TELE|nr:hypothetical protein AAFF_G00160230 [Aldrovandia affinis]